MNGKDGTEFDWYVNEHISNFMVFYNDNLGVAKFTLYNTGDALNESDSGWSFMAGNEEQEYAKNYKNFELLKIGYVWQQLDSDIFKFITSSVGSRYIRISSN